jgi:hypothetical protein
VPPCPCRVLLSKRFRAVRMLQVAAGDQAAASHEQGAARTHRLSSATYDCLWLALAAALAARGAAETAAAREAERVRQLGETVALLSAQCEAAAAVKALSLLLPAPPADAVVRADAQQGADGNPRKAEAGARGVPGRAGKRAKGTETIAFRARATPTACSRGSAQTLAETVSHATEETRVLTASLEAAQNAGKAAELRAAAAEASCEKKRSSLTLPAG